MTEGNSSKPLDLEQALTEEFKFLHGPEAGDGSLASLYERIHALVGKNEGRSALCLSGGGIRSASFGLGVLQALAKRKLLFEFHYLSTVSGGGYIGSWLSAWRARVKKDNEVENDLTHNVTDRYIEPAELAELRANSNYLTPKLGAMSADTWTLAALYIRNLLLNWLIFLPAILGLLLVPILSNDLMLLAAGHVRSDYVEWAALLLLLVALTMSASGRFDRGRWRVSQGWYLLWILLPTYIAAMLLCLSAASLNGAGIDKIGGAKAGAALYAVSWILAIAFRKPRSAVPAGVDTNPWLLGVAWVFAGAIAGALIGAGYELGRSDLAVGADMRPLVVLGIGWVALSMFLAESAYLGLASYSKKGDIEREWLARSSGWFVALTLGWAALAALVLYANDIVSAVWGIWPVLIAGGGAGIAGSWIGSSAKTLATVAGKRVESLSMTKILSLAAVIFLAAVAIILSTFLPGVLTRLAGCLQNFDILGPAGLGLATAVAAFVLCAVAAFGIAAFVNVNRFSSHALYRNRLTRAFLGAARAGYEEIQGSKRKRPKKSPTRDPFTGFDAKDNPRLNDVLQPDPRVNGVLQPGLPPRLFHVVNMALNVVGGENLAWQERKAEPFAATPLRCGNDNVGFWPTGEYGSTTGGLTLGTAMAISGAAASPNMGYHSSPLVGLLMALFNVRLGWWLGNPSRPEAASREGPRWGFVQVVQELFGLTTDSSKYVYLSDGGHFENLGIYEMVRRRCHLIVASDAGADPDCAFEDLGNAVRKIWIDLGVQIDFQKIDMKKRGAASLGLYCAIATIRYPEDATKNGYLLYLKPGFPDDGSLPADVTAYGIANPAFPHESTGDQFFSESQMESYRSLGSHIIDVIFGPVIDVPAVPTGAPQVFHPTKAMHPYWQHVDAYVTPKIKSP